MNVYVMQKHCHTSSWAHPVSLNSQYKTDLHFQQLYTTGTTCHYIPYKQNITFIFLLHVYIDFFCFNAPSFISTAPAIFH